MNVCVLGFGRIGQPLSTAVAEAGHKVYLLRRSSFDSLEVQNGELPIIDDPDVLKWEAIDLLILAINIENPTFEHFKREFAWLNKLPSSIKIASIIGELTNQKLKPILY